MLRIQFSTVGPCLYAVAAEVKVNLTSISYAGYKIVFGNEHRFLSDNCLSVCEGQVTCRPYGTAEEAKAAKANFEKAVEEANSQQRFIGNVELTRLGTPDTLGTLVVSSGNFPQICTPKLQLAPGGVTYCETVEEAVKLMDDLMPLAYIANGKEYGGELKVRLARVGSTLYAQTVAMPDRLRGAMDINEARGYKLRSGDFPAMGVGILALPGRDRDADSNIVSNTFADEEAAKIAQEHFIKLIESVGSVTVGGDRLKVEFTQNGTRVTARVINVAPGLPIVCRDSWAIIPGQEAFVGGTFLNAAPGVAEWTFATDTEASNYVSNISELIKEANDYEEEYVSGPKLGITFIRTGQNLKVVVIAENLEQCYYDDDWTLQCRSKISLAAKRLYIGVGEDNYTYTSAEQAKQALKRFVGLAKEANSEVVGDISASRLRVKFWFNGSNLSAQVLKQEKSIGGKTIAQLGGFSIKTAGGPGIYGKHLYIRGSNQLRDGEIAKHEYASAKEAQEAFSVFDAMITAVNHPDAATYLYHCNNGLLNKVERVKQFAMPPYFIQTVQSPLCCPIGPTDRNEVSPLKVFVADKVFYIRKTKAVDEEPAKNNTIYGGDFEPFEKALADTSHINLKDAGTVGGDKLKVWFGRARNVVLAQVLQCKSAPSASIYGKMLKTGSIVASMRRNKLVVCPGDSGLLACRFDNEEQAATALWTFCKLVEQANA